MVGVPKCGFSNVPPARPSGHFLALLALALFMMPLVAADSTGPALMPQLSPNDIMAIHVRTSRDSNQFFRGVTSSPDTIQPVVTLNWQGISPAPPTAKFSISMTNISTNAKYNNNNRWSQPFSATPNSSPAPFASPPITPLSADSLPPGTYMLTATITQVLDNSSPQNDITGSDGIVSDNTSTVFVTVSNSSQQLVPEISPVLVFTILAGVMLLSRSDAKIRFK